MTTITNVLAKMKRQAKDAAQMQGNSHMLEFCKVSHLKVAEGSRVIGGRRWLGLSMALLALLVPRIAPAQERVSKTQKSEQQLMARNEDSSKDTQNAVPDDPKYAIGPQDILSISVWKEPDITQTVVVRPDGRISLPLVNDVKAAGLTPTQLAASVTAGLQKYLADPRVTVVVTQINSQRIYVLGEVNKAGAYALFPGMTFLQALSSAGGFTQFADVKKIYLLRVENGRQAKFLFNYKDVVHGRAPEQNIALKTGDTIIVP
jgi:polysaccharide biosynthesis/export protein